jgi:aryl-alcohol dehydrogenase-like predicted oxidoreductase
MVVPNEVLPRIGLGMAALGRPGYINLNRSTIFGNTNERTIESMQQRANLVMDEVFRITNDYNSNNEDSTIQSKILLPWFDCARSYGLSEQFVGDYLRKHNIQKDKVYVSSKWGYTYVADFQVSLPAGVPHEIKDHSVNNFLKQLQESIHTLGEYINLYQIHSATIESGVLSDPIVHNELMKCKKQYNWSIGLSVSSPQQGITIQEAVKINVNNERLFDSVQCTYNVLEQSAYNALIDAYNNGIDIKEGLANGRVLSNPILIKYSKNEIFNCTPDQLALGCILAQPFQPRVLSGAVTSDQVLSNYKAIDIATKLVSSHDTILTEIMQSCIMDSQAYWSERSALQWN